MRTALKAAIACGGTGGHIFPGLATANVLRQRGWVVELWLAGKDIERPAVQHWDGPVVTVPAEGFPSQFSWRAFRTAWRLARSARVCRRHMRSSAPSVLLAMGSYASVGPAYGALREGIPVVLHESNVIPGRAIRLLAPWAAAVAISFDESSYYLRKARSLVLTGMPLRADLEEAVRLPPPPRDGLFTVLIMGGSRGAHRLNEIVVEALIRVHRQGHHVRALHLTGAADEEAVRTAYTQAGVPHQVMAFTPHMAEVYRAADLAICRAGAATCAELCAFALPALLVPYPFAAYDHQMANARALQKIGAADVVPEADLDSHWLADYILNAMRNPGRLAKQRLAARQRAPRQGAERLAELVERVAQRSHE